MRVGDQHFKHEGDVLVPKNILVSSAENAIYYVNDHIFPSPCVDLIGKMEKRHGSPHLLKSTGNNSIECVTVSKTIGKQTTLFYTWYDIIYINDPTTSSLEGRQIKRHSPEEEISIVILLFHNDDNIIILFPSL